VTDKSLLEGSDMSTTLPDDTVAVINFHPISLVSVARISKYGRRHGTEYSVFTPDFTRPMLCAYTTREASRQRHPASLLTRHRAYKDSISLLIAKLLMTPPCASHAT
jgi:NAD-dependent oxidoreductase involved in siderophore biosynthesis